MSEVSRLFTDGGIWMWAILAAGALHAIPVGAQMIMARKADFSPFLWSWLAVILLLGATGTVAGCVQGFAALEAHPALERSALLMRMLGIALIPAAFSMVVAIPALVATGIASSLVRGGIRGSA